MNLTRVDELHISICLNLMNRLPRILVKSTLFKENDGLRISDTLQIIAFDTFDPLAALAFQLAWLAACLRVPTIEQANEFLPSVPSQSVTSVPLLVVSCLCVRSLNLSPKRWKCGLMVILYLTNSSIQSTKRFRLSLGRSLLPPSSSCSPVNWVYALGIEL